MPFYCHSIGPHNPVSLVQIYNGLRNAVQDALFLLFTLFQHLFGMFTLGTPFFFYLNDNLNISIPRRLHGDYD